MYSCSIHRDPCPHLAIRGTGMKITGNFPVGPMAKTCAPNAGGLGSIPVHGTRSYILQLRSPSSQINK